MTSRATGDADATLELSGRPEDILEAIATLKQAGKVETARVNVFTRGRWGGAWFWLPAIEKGNAEEVRAQFHHFERQLDDDAFRRLDQLVADLAALTK
jgi:hypothetical protein